MTCQEFQRVLPELEGGGSFEAEEHLRICSHCWDLVSELDAIAQQARLLQASEEPSPRVWNSIEITLRHEGLIRQSQQDRPARLWTGWRFRWLAPVAAALLLVSGFFLREHRGGPEQLTARTVTPAATVEANPPAGAISRTGAEQAGADEDQLLNIVAKRAPSLRDGYASNLRAVDAYIRDAESSARENPNDQIAQQYLTNAYEQRAMVYEIAMTRSLP
ncbi:MAG: hypothetical protein ACLP6G_00735 [Terriglobales bacterium]